MHDLHNHSFLTSLFLTEVHHYACAVNIPRLSHGCDDGIPRELPGDTKLFSTVARDARGSRRKRPSWHGKRKTDRLLVRSAHGVLRTVKERKLKRKTWHELSWLAQDLAGCGRFIDGLCSSRSEVRKLHGRLMVIRDATERDYP